MTLSHGKIFGLRVTGVERLQKRIQSVRKNVMHMRRVGVPRIGRYLLKSKKEECKMGLYSGQETAPNKWRYGWEILDGPAKNYFTKAVLNAHEMIDAKYSLSGDTVGVFLNPAVAPHGAMIHGPIKSLSSYFYNERLQTYVRTRPWMRLTRKDKEACVGILSGTYGKTRMAALGSGG